MEDINMNEGLLKVIGKGKKERIVPMRSNAQKALQRYLFRYRPKPAHQAVDNVFLSVMGKKYYRWFTEIMAYFQSDIFVSKIGSNIRI